MIVALLNWAKPYLLKAALLVALILAGYTTTCVVSHKLRAAKAATAQAAIAGVVQKAEAASQELAGEATIIQGQRDQVIKDVMVAKVKQVASKTKLDTEMALPVPKDLTEDLALVTAQRDAALTALADETAAHQKDKQLLDLTVQQLTVTQGEIVGLKTSLLAQVQLTSKVTDDWNTEKTWHRRWKNVTISMSLVDLGAALGTRIHSK